MKTGVILLAGGQGTRMGGNIPKQFLPLKGLPIALYSHNVLMNLPSLHETVVVCDPSYHHLFSSSKQLSFAPPGERRQDSVYNGLKALDPTVEWVLIHDSARPFIKIEMMADLLASAKEAGAATLAMPVKFTVKERSPDGFVTRTFDRSSLFEIQTPQVVRRDLLIKGFEFAHSQGLTVTDDVSLVELLNHPVKLVNGSYANLKITTPEDLKLAEEIVKSFA